MTASLRGYDSEFQNSILGGGLTITEADVQAGDVVFIRYAVRGDAAVTGLTTFPFLTDTAGVPVTQTFTLVGIDSFVDSGGDTWSSVWVKCELNSEMVAAVIAAGTHSITSIGAADFIGPTATTVFGGSVWWVDSGSSTPVTVLTTLQTATALAVVASDSTFTGIDPLAVGRMLLGSWVSFGLSADAGIAPLTAEVTGVDAQDAAVASGVSAGTWYAVRSGYNQGADIGVTQTFTVTTNDFPDDSVAMLYGGLLLIEATEPPPWDVLSTVATIDHDILTGVEPDQHHSEVHPLWDDIVHTGGFIYKEAAGATITDADMTAPVATDGMVAVTYDTSSGITLFWQRIGGIWVAVEATV